MQKITLADANDFMVEVELEEITWFLHFSWNSEVERWEFSVENAENEAIISGLPIIADEPITQFYKKENLPSGDFIAVMIDESAELGRDSFINGAAEFIYIEG